MLRRNRDFMLLQGGQLLSTAGSESTAVAYPLLVLALTSSPAQAGVVACARIAPSALLGPLGGIAADRFDRRAVMLAADGTRALAVAALAGALLSGPIALWPIVVAAFVEGAGAAFFAPAAAGALRSLVPARELPAAASAQQARAAIVAIAGPPLGGALFALGRALPFVADALSYACSAVSLLLIRTPFQQPRAHAPRPLSEAWRFLWRHPFLRTTTFLYGLSNFLAPGWLFVLIVVADADRIGVMLASLGAALLAGSVASTALRRLLPTRTILRLELWAGLGPALFVIWPSPYVLMASLLAWAVAAPVTDSVVLAHRLALTPDALVGRLESVRRTVALAIAPLGPITAGAMIAASSPRATVAMFAAAALALAVWGTLSAPLNLTEASAERSPCPA